MKEATKKKEEPIIYEYDMTAQQTIPFTLEKNGRFYKVSHTVRPLTDERFFRLEIEKEERAKSISKSQTEVLIPSARLWDELILSRQGYKEVDDIRAKTNMMDKVHCILGLLHAQPKELVQDTDNPEEILEAEILFDDDEPTEVQLEVLQGGVLITTSHFFQPETQEQMDEYLSILANTPKPHRLSSSDRKQSKSERVAQLYDDTCTKRSGYKDGTEVPAWHKLPAVMHFFANQFSRI